MANTMTVQATEGYRLLREAAGIIPAPDAALIEMLGEDRLEWLQGQATNDLRSLKPGQSIAFCLCEPTGQILAVCHIWDVDGRHLLGCDRAALQSVLRRFESMVVLEDVQAIDLTQNYDLVSLQGPLASQQVPSLQSGFALQNDRCGLGGVDLWLPHAEAEALRATIKTVDIESAEIARIEAGIPKHGVDIGPKTLPPELGPHFEAMHVSYNKGCYTGQEVLMRIHSRGHTNRTWGALILEAPVEPGAKVSHASRDDAGVVTSATISPAFGPIAAAMLRNEAAKEGETVQVSDAKGKVLPFPLIRPTP